MLCGRMVATLDGFSRRTRRRLAAFRKDRSGIAATEFALVLPVMLTMYFGMVELTQGLGHARKSVILARTLADMTSQSRGITNSDMNTIFSASKSVLAPYPSTDVAMRISSVTIDGAGNAYVDWSDVKNTGTALPYSPHGRCNLANSFIPASLRVPRSYLIYAEVRLKHTPTIGQVLSPNGITMTENMPMRPRVSQTVLRENTPSTPCSPIP
jgi:Flp pilus assembly protein TadG